MRLFFIKLLVVYLERHGYICRNLLADYAEMCRIHQGGIMAGRCGGRSADYSKIWELAKESQSRYMSKTEMNNHIVDYEREILEIEMQK